MSGCWTTPGSPTSHPVGEAIARVVTSGPDEDLEQIEFAMLHAISCARRSIRVVTPYFLPPDMLTTALSLAAMRGVAVDVVVPEHSNHTILDWARRAPLRILLEAGCRVWLLQPPFDHSKLMMIDDAWSLIGSANWDIRSFRLNFELNVEIQDEAFARTLAEVASNGRLLTLAEVESASLAAAAARQRRPPAAAVSLMASSSLDAPSVAHVCETPMARPSNEPSGQRNAARIFTRRRRARMQRVAPRPRFGNLQVEHDRLVVGRSEVERAGEGAGEAVRQAAVEAKGHDVAAEMRHFARTDIGEAGNEARSDRIVVADDRRRLAVQRGCDAQQLAAVQELAVRQMDVGEGDLADLHDLAAPARQAAGQGGRRQRQHLGCREIVPAPDPEAVDTAGPGQAMIVTGHPGGQHVHVLRHFLHEQHVRPLALEQRDDVADRGPFEPQQIPADHPHPGPT